MNEIMKMTQLANKDNKWYKEYHPSGEAVLGFKNALITGITKEIEGESYNYFYHPYAIKITLDFVIPVANLSYDDKAVIITDKFEIAKPTHIILFQGKDK